MSLVLSFLYCLAGSLWACYWSEDVTTGMRLRGPQARVYLRSMVIQHLTWPISALYWLWWRGYWPSSDRS